jgi:hypothetical protein
MNETSNIGAVRQPDDIDDPVCAENPNVVVMKSAQDDG